MKLIFTQSSRSDLDDIFDFIARDSLEKADEFVNTLRKECQKIAESPYIGRPYRGIYKFPFRRYAIYYEIIDNMVFIHHILSGYRDESQFV